MVSPRFLGGLIWNAPPSPKLPQQLKIPNPSPLLRILTGEGKQKKREGKVMNKLTVTAGIVAMVVGLLSFSSLAQAGPYYGGHGAHYGTSGYGGHHRGYYGGYRYGHRTPAYVYRRFHRYGRYPHASYRYRYGHRGSTYGYRGSRYRVHRPYR